MIILQYLIMILQHLIIMILLFIIEHYDSAIFATRTQFNDICNNF